MVEPLTWLVLQHLNTLVRKITVANGYRTDIGNALVINDRSQIPESAAPFTLIVGTDTSFDEARQGRRTTGSDMDIVIELSLPYGTDNAELVAHRARADFITAAEGWQRDAPVGFNNFTLSGARIGTPEDGSAIVIAQVSARAGLSETKSPA